MPTYRRGSQGEEVGRIQSRLKELALYLGPIDGDFGGGTESAVKAFQRRSGLVADGIVGSNTWKRLFPAAEIPTPAIVDKPLTYRTLVLTGAFETSAGVPECFACVTGDFDGQGLSFGGLQWNFGQGTLQALLQQMEARHAGVLEDVLADRYPVLRAVLTAPHDEQLAWARSIQDDRHRLFEPWHGLFKALGRREQCQTAQVESASQLHQDAVGLCRSYGVRSERALALMFDIRVQNGSISPLTRAQIERDVRQLERSGGADEVGRLRIIANRRAEAANPKWVEDVRRRKLTIADGEGVVHGRHYHLEGQYGIGLKPAID